MAWIGQVVAEVRALASRPDWPIVQSVDQPETLPAIEYGRALDVALASPDASGVIVFTLEAALAPDMLAITQDRFKYHED